MSWLCDITPKADRSEIFKPFCEYVQLTGSLCSSWQVLGAWKTPHSEKHPSQNRPDLSLLMTITDPFSPSFYGSGLVSYCWGVLRPGNTFSALWHQMHVRGRVCYFDEKWNLLNFPFPLTEASRCRPPSRLKPYPVILCFYTESTFFKRSCLYKGFRLTPANFKERIKRGKEVLLVKQTQSSFPSSKSVNND